MPGAIQYIHGTAFGTYYVECEVVEKKDDTFLIKFFDDYAGEHVQHWVNRTALRFPKFSEYGAI